MNLDIQSYDAQNFNDLLTIEEADERLKLVGSWTTHLAKIASIFLKYNIQNYWGLVLLHKHFDLKKDEQTISVLYKSPNIRYRIAPQNRFWDNNHWPSVFSFTNHSKSILCPLEYSTEVATKVAISAIELNQAFLCELREYLFSNCLEHIFGIISAKIALKPGFSFLEYNNEENVSILKVEKSESIESISTIKTSWYFTSNNPNGNCIHCFIACVPQQSGYHAPNHNGGKFRS